MQDVKTDRNKYIGGSDIPIILGISPFKTRYDLLLEKAELRVDGFDGNQYTEYGNTLEPQIRDYVNKTYNTNFVEDKLTEGDVRQHFDGIEDWGILEIKTTSQIHEDVNEYKVYLPQLLFYMEYSGKTNGMLAVYERPSDFNTEFDPERLHIYKIDIKDYQDLLDEINAAVNMFRYDLQRLKTNPMLSEYDLMPSSIKLLTEQIMALEEQISTFKAIQETQEKIKEELRTKMTELGIKKWEMPNGTKITNVLDGDDKEVKKFNASKFKEENTEMYEKYVEKTLVKGRKGYLLINENR